MGGEVSPELAARIWASVGVEIAPHIENKFNYGQVKMVMIMMMVIMVLAVLGYRGLHGADLLLGVLPRRQGGAQRAQVRDRDRGLRQAAVQAGAGEGQTNENTASGHVTPYSSLIGQVRVGEVLQQLLVNLKESGHPKNTNVQQRRKFSKNQNIFDFL